MTESLPRVSSTAILLILVIVSCLFAEPVGISVREKPDGEAPVVAFVPVGESLRVLQVQRGWVQVRQGDIEGWMDLNELWSVMEQKTFQVPLQLAVGLPRFDFGCCQAAFAKGRFQGLVDFLVGKSELSRKMNDPYYGHRVVRISSEWGPFYSLRTRHSYVKGIYLARFFDDRVRLGLAKRRPFYGEFFGAMWSEEFVQTVLRGNRGWLRNPKIFGKGREYFLGLSYHF
jgi:hypothetical protein